MFSFILITICCIAIACANQVKTTPATKIPVDLDLPPSQRWAKALAHFGGPKAGKAILSYFNNLDKFVPSEVLKVLEWVAADLDTHGHAIPADLRDELRALATGLNLDLGMVVALNFLYELRWLAPAANTTGPCDSCVHPKSNVCTSIVATAADQSVWHARNMDWNLPNDVRELTFQCQMMKGGKVEYEGACFIGFVGMASAFKAGAFGVTIDERDKGGDLLVDVLAALDSAWDPTHLLRHVMQTATSYDEAHQLLATLRLAAPAYYIISGPEATNGAVLTRNRDGLKSNRVLAPPKEYFQLETNYDFDEQPPSYDDRRRYALEYMRALGSEAAITSESMFKVISTWPVMNNHTSYTTLSNVKSGSFQVFIRQIEP